MFIAELELQALEGFPDWFKQEYGVDLNNENDIKEFQQPITSSWNTPEASRAIQRARTQPNSNYKEVIQKIASVLVDMVIDEQKSLKRYD